MGLEVHADKISHGAYESREYRVFRLRYTIRAKRRHAFAVVEQQYIPEKKRFANSTLTLSIGYF